MSNIDLIIMGMKNLWRRKLRTFLTVLGVVIGATSIIVMLSLGFGMTKANEDQLASMGSLTTITISKGGRYGGWEEEGSSKKDEKVLNDKAVATFKGINNVVAVTPVMETDGLLVAGKYQNYVQIRGIDPDAMEAFEYDKVSQGRILNSTDELAAVFGSWVSRNFWNPKSNRRGRQREVVVDLMKDRMFFTFDHSYGYKPMPGEKRPVFKQYKINAVGMFEEGNQETDWYTYMPITTVQKMIKEKEKAEGTKSQSGKKKDPGFQQILVKVNDVKNVQAVQKIIKEDMGYSAYSLNDWLEEMQKGAGVLQAVLGGIGAISLLVAAIGITNTMVMSIYERTKEIGVMKVIGASLKDIKRLFLFESALIGLLGGVLGVALSLLLSFLANKFGGSFLASLGTGGGDSKISIIPLWLIFATMGFSAFIGVVSGYFPAKKAMNLSALEAIRTE